MDGILCLDKPAEMTSFLCCSVFRRLLNEKKIGHAGTLDPMATGVLPLLVGRATRSLDFLPVQDKRYTATLRFGYTSDTQDIWGSVTATGGTLPSLQDIENVIDAFRGDIWQIPPMVSAIQKDGVRLYDLARQGIVIEREARLVTVYELNVLTYDETQGELTIDCHCSKGTYIRTICDDLGQALHCGAVMTSLRRTMAAGFTLSDCVTIEQARELSAAQTLHERLLPTDSALTSYEALTITEAQTVRFQNGGALALERLKKQPQSLVRVYAPSGLFLGLGEPQNGGLKVAKLL